MNDSSEDLYNEDFDFCQLQDHIRKESTKTVTPSILDQKNSIKQTKLFQNTTGRLKDSHRAIPNISDIFSLVAPKPLGSPDTFLSYPDPEKMTSLECSRELDRLHFEGILLKKGFRFFKLWRYRKVVVDRNILAYYTVDNTKLRYGIEIHPDFRVTMENVPNHPFAFSVYTGEKTKVWLFDANTIEERDSWIATIRFCIAIIKRLQNPPTLKGDGDVYNKYAIGPVLGRGRFGVVKMAEALSDHTIYAVKIINRTKVSEKTLEHELTVLRVIKERITHPNIVQTFEIYEDDYLIHIVMEYMSGGDLFERISRKGHYTESDAATITRIIAEVLDNLHKHNIIHRDIKPENIIYSSLEDNASLKLADFGCCLIRDMNDDSNMELVGTPGFVAPEVISSCVYTPACDVFGLGVTLYILLVGYPPFIGKTTQEIFEKTQSGEYLFFPNDWLDISSSALSLVRAMMDVNPAKRITVTEILNHPWIHDPHTTTMDSTAHRLERMNNTRKARKLLLSTRPGTTPNDPSAKEDTPEVETGTYTEGDILAIRTPMEEDSSKLLDEYGMFSPNFDR
ncbi:hypothetical protein WA158_001117 [Blastocystis sp. Blastoise]